MAFYYLLLGHLIGDFVFQTNRMAENKGMHWKWNLRHVLVVTLCTSVFSYRFGYVLLSLVMLNGFIHFFMDYNKSRICKALHLSDLSGFLLDQLIHIILLYAVSKTAVYGREQLIDFKTVSLLIALAAATYVSAVVTQFILASLFPRADSRFFREGEKYTGIFTRIYAAVVFYLSFVISPCYLWLLGVSAGFLIIKFKLGWSKWMSPSQFVIKLLLDTAISAVCLFPVILR